MARFIIGLLMFAVIVAALVAAATIGPLLAVVSLVFSSVVVLAVMYLYDTIRHAGAARNGYDGSYDGGGE